MVSALLIPYANDGLGNSKPIFPDDAQRKWIYVCPVCKGHVFVRKGRIMTPHFAHKMGIKSCTATGETIQHMQAKGILYRSLTGHSPDITVSVDQPCSQCGGSHPSLRYLGNIWGEPIVEYKFETSSGKSLNADLALLNKDDGSIRFLIEVRATSAVTQEKEQLLSEDKISWIEVKAEDVISDRAKSSHIPIINSGNIQPTNKCRLPLAYRNTPIFRV